jgi:hypothetical protein
MNLSVATMGQRLTSLMARNSDIGTAAWARFSLDKNFPIDNIV